jgi:hypothetical protein
MALEPLSSPRPKVLGGVADRDLVHGSWSLEAAWSSHSEAQEGPE